MERNERKCCRAQVTKLLNSARDKLKNSNEDVEELVVLRDRLVKANDMLQVANDKMAPLIKEEEFEAEFGKVLEYEDQVTEILSRLRLRIEADETGRSDAGSERSSRASQRSKRSSATNKGELPTADETGRSDAGSERFSCASQRTRSRGADQPNLGKSNVKLPKLELRKFKGDLADWTLFWEQFRTAVHENDSLDAVAKFNYLEQVLIGKAAATISGLTPSETSYKDAIDLLKHEYGNHQRIIDNHVQKLMTLKPVKNKLDAVGLRSLYNAASSITRNLASLGVDPNQYGMMVKTVILNCVPYTMRIDYNKRNHAGEDAQEITDISNEIKSLLSYLKVEVESIELSQLPGENKLSEVVNKESKRVKNHDKKHVSDSRNSFTAAGLMTTISECIFCKSKDHNAANCTKSDITLEKKKEILKESRRCFRCTEPNHTSKFCKNAAIQCAACKRKHATAMCDPSYKKPVDKSKPAGAGTLFTTSDAVNEKVLLQTAKAYITTSNDVNSSVFARLVLDGGSQLSCVKEDVSKKLGLKSVGARKLSLMPFGSKQRTAPKLYNKVELKLISQYHNEPITITAIEVTEICVDSFETPDVDKMQALQNLNLADITVGDAQVMPGISLMIGADNYWKIATGETIRLSDDLAAMNTKLGWTVLGSDGFCSDEVSTNLVSVLHLSENDSGFDMQQLWNLESIGINDKEAQKTSTETFIKDNITLRDDRFEVTLPWNDGCNIDNNYQGAVARVKSLIYKLRKDSRLVEYDDAMRDLMHFGYAELVTDQTNTGKVYYMPHCPVYREDKTTTKLRIVFDASAHAPGFPSLNDLLYAGENLVKDLMNIFLNFRVGAIGVIADIEKAFLQISLARNDRDLHRFLWYKHPINDVNRLPQLEEYRMTRVTFGVTCSPFILAATLKKLFSLQLPKLDKTARLLSNSFYVDDLIFSVNSVERAVELYKDAKAILQQGKMNLRKWNTNDADLKAFLSESESNDDLTYCPKVLGVFWDTTEDELRVDLTSVVAFVDKNPECSKRNVLQAISRIYDPLSMLSPFTVRAKILLQKIWKSNSEWDAVLGPEFQLAWKKWCNDLHKVSGYGLSRNVTTIEQCEYELHVFADASPEAYGAVAYIKSVTDEEVKISFLIAKCRVAPIKQNGSCELSLPRLELTAALCAARLTNYIVSNCHG